MTPETQFAQHDNISIAYQVFGAGPHDLVVIPGWLSNIDIFWEEPRVVRFFLALAEFSRVILLDKRGTGLSDRVAPPTLEEQIDDVTAVMDAVDSERAVLFGYSEGACMCALFAATHPERTEALITVGGYARWARSDDFPFGSERSDIENWINGVENEWGTPVAIEYMAPTLAEDEVHRHWLSKFYRSSASKADATALLFMNLDIDLRSVLPSIVSPALVLQAIGDLTTPFELGRDFGSRIPSARFVEISSDDHVPYASCSDAIIREVQAFLGEAQKPRVIDRVLTTVLFTDIVDSTLLAAEKGDQQWSDLLEAHHTAVRRELKIFRGNEVKTTGDGFHATFDGPARAVQCAVAIRQATRQLGLDLRIGVHTGEVEIRGDDMEGVAIHIAARVSSIAAGGEILVSRTVKDLVAGSGLEFEDFGTHELKGVPDTHQLFRVVSSQ